MKNPGPFKAGTDEHRSLLLFCAVMAHRFDVGVPLMLGKIVKLNEAMCDAADSDEGFGNVIIEYKFKKLQGD